MKTVPGQVVGSWYSSLVAVNGQIVVAVGSNIDAERHVSWALSQLLHRAQMLHLSRFVITPPVGMTDGSGAFLNGVVALPIRSDGLQEWLHTLEIQAGRDRQAAGQSWKARPLDLDVLFPLHAPHPLADGPWLEPLVADLLSHLGLGPPPTLKAGVAMTVAGQTVGLRPITLREPT